MHIFKIPILFFFIFSFLKASGIVSFRISKGKNLPKPINCYIDLKIDGVSTFKTRVLKKTISPTWNSSYNKFVKNIFESELHVQLLETVDHKAVGVGGTVLGSYKVHLAELIGLKNFIAVLLDDNESLFAQLELSVGFAPIQITADEESSKSKYFNLYFGFIFFIIIFILISGWHVIC